MRKRKNKDRFDDFDSAYEAWKKEDEPRHPDSVAATAEGKCMKMVWYFGRWLFEDASVEQK